MRSIVGAAAVLVCLVLAGCDTEAVDSASSAPVKTAPAPSASSPSPTASSPTTTSSPTEASYTNAEEGFLTSVRSSSESLNQRLDSQLLASAVQVCSSLDTGATYDEAVAPLLDDGVSDEAAMVLASNAVFEFCDKHDSIIDVALGGIADRQEKPTGEPKDQFLAGARADPFFAEVTDDAVLMLGTTVCDGFTRGDSLEATLGYFDLMPKETAVKFIRMSVELLCPKHAERLK